MEQLIMWYRIVSKQEPLPVAAAMTGGDVLVRDAVWEHNRPLISKLLEMGVEVTEESEGIRVRSQLENLKAVHVKTLPHPGFPTDMQAQFTALMTVAKGNPHGGDGV